MDELLDALAVYRLTRLVIEDRITLPFRERVFARWAPDETSLGYLLTCPWCVSIWAGAAVVASRAVCPRVWRLAGRALAYSAVTGGLAERLG